MILAINRDLLAERTRQLSGFKVEELEKILSKTKKQIPHLPPFIRDLTDIYSSDSDFCERAGINHNNISGAEYYSIFLAIAQQYIAERKEEIARCFVDPTLIQQNLLGYHRVSRCIGL